MPNPKAALAKKISLVPLFDLKFLTELAARE
jgi:hypothetical protein